MSQVKKEDLIAEFKKLMVKYTKKFGNTNMTRDWWRDNTKYSSNTLSKWYNTFSNFKEQALKESGVKKRENVSIKTTKDTNVSTYFVTSIVEGANIETGFMSAIDTFCKENSANKVLLWVRGVRPIDAFTPEQLSTYEGNLCTEFVFNSKLKAKDFMLHPAQILPLTGLSRFGNRDCSLIIASPKQHMTSVPRAKNASPHTLWSTGTVSLPKYSSTRAGSLANQDNTLGGLIVEVVDSKKFHIRPVQYKDNCFIDLGTKYNSNGKVEKNAVKAEAIVWGDLHLTEEDIDAVRCSIEQTNYVKAKKVVIHDVCSWNSVNAHDINKYIVRADRKQQTLVDDYEYTATGLGYILNLLKPSKSDIYIVKSNHDNWVKRWVEKGDFIKDRTNSIAGAKAFINFCKGEDPIEVEVLDRITDQNIRNKVHFMKKDEQLKVAGFELGQHGENGANGSKGNIQGFGRSHDKIVVGHSHSPNIFYSAIQVGTNSRMDLPYATGDSSWMHANCIIYPNGTFQLITFIDENWRLDK